MAETILLDPSAVATNRTQLDITAYIDADGVDWGDAAIVASLSDGTLGSLPVDFRVPNRTVSIPLILKAIGATSFDTIRQQIQAKAALFQREGGWLSRQTSVGTVHVDVVNATLKLGGDWFQANRSFDTTAVLTLECLPDWYGAEITLDDIVELTLPEIATTLKLSAANAAIKGDYPGRLRLVVDEDEAQSQRGLLVGLRARNYSAASTARLAYEAEALTALDAAASFALAGSSGGNVIRHSSLSSNWTSVLSTQATGGGAHMTHVGSYRVWARVYATTPTTTSVFAPEVRLIWDVGDLSYPEENAAWAIPASGSFYIADLGEVRLDQAPQGTHRWQGIIQARTTISGLTFSVDRIWFQPLDEFACKLQASTSLSSIVTYTAHDEFNQTAGALTAKVMPLGGSWAGAGDADDFNVDATNKIVTRAPTADDTVQLGRFGLAGTGTPSAIAVRVDLKSTTAFGTERYGLLARYVNTTNHLLAVRGQSLQVGDYGLHVYKVVAGVKTLLQPSDLAVQQEFGDWRTMQLYVDTAGRWFVWFGTSLTLVASGQDNDLATGGTLASGRFGIYNEVIGAGGNVATYSYDNFAAWVPTDDAVMYASQSAEVRWDAMIREDSTGTAWGPVAGVTGDLIRVPPSGLETRPVEVFVKGSRGDLASVPDSGIDNISARAFYRPAWLTVPGP